MSTVQLSDRDAEARAAPLDSVGARSLTLPLAIGVALLALVLYAAFEHGAVALPAGTRVEVSVAAIAAIAAAGWLWSGTLRISASRVGIAGVLLLAAFACWSAITLLWSVSPDQTWIELNRVLAYVIVLCLAIALGASHPRALGLVANGALAVALIVTAYALGQKLLPGLHIPGLFNLDQTGGVPRLQEPLGYWNALAIFVTFGVPIALSHAVNGRHRRVTRLAAACAVELMFLTVGLTYSRGGLLALAVAVLVTIWLSRESLRSLVWCASAMIAAAPALALGLALHPLTVAGTSLARRERAGAVLALVLIACTGALILGGRRLLAIEPRLRLDPSRRRALGRLAALAAAAAVLLALVAVALSSRGIGGTVSHAWTSFTAPRAPSNVAPGRLLTTDSYRWLWWSEAARAFADRPAGGWGAGSFGVVHLLYRHNALPVQQPHSVPLQFLAETGAIGAFLGVAAFALLLRAAALGVRRRPAGSTRLLAVALFAGAVAYVIHSLYDWDWNIPAVTLPALMFIGVLIGGSAPREGSERSMRRRLAAPGWKLVSLAAVTTWLCAFALSAALPSLAASDVASALVKASSASASTLGSAESDARLASRLDPLSDAGPRAQATIAIHRGRFSRARAYLSEAVGRDPTDELAWEQLALLYSGLGDRQDAAAAARRVVALDPHGQLAQGLARAGLVPRNAAK
jgi:hypothetical protein